MEEKALIVNIPWTNDIDENLMVSAGNDLAQIRNQVEQNIAQLWHCSFKQFGGYIVTRIDKTSSGLELCLVLGEGTGFEYFAPEFVNFARRKNIGFRTHIKRKGLIRMWQKLGITVDEYILRG